MTSLLLLFPGQGSQTPGMAEHLWEFAVARDTFAEAGDLLGWDIGELCRHGSMEELTRTDRTQLTILTCSVATWRVLDEAGLAFSVAAGHSLGEYSALVATGRMTFADAVRVVDARGRAMHACGEEREGAMAAILGIEDEVVDEICASLHDVWPANYNAPGQVVVSGSPEGVQAAAEVATERGARRVKAVPVSGAFHTPFMAGAAESLGKALAGVEFLEGGGAAGPAFFSTTEMRYPATSELRDVMARQLVSPVRFTQSIRAILAGADTPARADATVPTDNPAGAEAPTRALEVGPGKVLCGLMKRIARDIPAADTADRAGLDAALVAAGADS